MKGISVKKLAALGVVSSLALAALGFGAVTYDGTPLVDENGVPVAKVVVGEKAAASDGVAAAKIAAYLANNAFKKSVYSAELSGQPTCSVSAPPANGAGTCAVTNKRVTLEVQLPGESGGAYKFTTLIDDYIDRRTENRDRSQSGEDRYDTGSSEQGTNNRFDFPFYGVYDDPNQFEPTFLSPNIMEAMLRVTGNELTALKTETVVDEKSAKRWEERQYLWVAGYNRYTDRDDNENIKLKPEMFAYSAKFFGVSGVARDGGIPVCTNDAATDGYLAGCSNSDTSYYLGNHRVKIKFLGEDWVITDIEAPNVNTLETDGEFTFGGRVTLAKESKYAILNVGGAPLEAEGIKVRLGDISVPVGSNNVAPAILDILDSSDQVIQQTQVNPGESTEVLTPSGSKVKIRVYQTAPGFTLTQKWAELAVVKDEKILEHGKEFDTTDNEDYEVQLKWVNNNKPSGATSNSTAAAADALREIVVYRKDFGGDEYSPGSTIPMVVNPANFKLKYLGLDLDKTKDYEDLSFKIETGKSLDAIGVNNASNYEDDKLGYPTCNEVTSFSGDVLTIKSKSKELKLVAPSQVSYNTLVDTAYVILANGTSDNTMIADVILPLETKLTCADGNKASYVYAAINHGFGTSAVAPKPIGFQYKPAGELGTSSEGGYLTITPDKDGSNNFEGLHVTLTEDSGRWTNDMHKKAELKFSYDKGSGSFEKYDSSFGGNVLDDDITYAPTNEVDGQKNYGSGSSRTLKVNQLTQRGSYLKMSDEDEVHLRVAKAFARLQFEISAAGEAAAAVNEETLAEGDEREWAGVRIKVKKISEDVGACTVGTGPGPTCQVDASGVRAVIVDAMSGTQMSTLEAVTPVAVGELVVLDSSAPSGTVIAVGGPAANTVSASALAGSSELNAPGKTVITRKGNVIVVAGYTASDTMNAVNQFLGELRKE